MEENKNIEQAKEQETKEQETSKSSTKKTEKTRIDDFMSRPKKNLAIMTEQFIEERDRKLDLAVKVFMENGIIKMENENLSVTITSGLDDIKTVTVKMGEQTKNFFVEDNKENEEKPEKIK